MDRRKRNASVLRSRAGQWLAVAASRCRSSAVRTALAAGLSLALRTYGAVPAADPGISQHAVLPILMRHCWACHGPAVQEGSLDLRSKAAMVRGGGSGTALVAGDPETSPMVRRVRSGECPPNKRLVEAGVKPVPESSLAKLIDWIAAGAPETAEPPDLAGSARDLAVSQKDREFWAFQSPRPVPVPAVKRPALTHNPIDAFVLSKLEARGLTFAAEPSRLTLLRRVCFDLTGLPPSLEMVDTFLADTQPGAYDRFVERLLASPHYGERWGRYWLDVAGYADVEGKREQHLPRPFAYRYRDYVIQAFNRDKPYDRFLLQQIAGDELADYETAAEISPEVFDNLVATAFLRLGPDPTWANITGFIPDRIDVMADAVDVLGGGVLGLTLKCARCHDHKFDPIPQRDYFRLLDLFKGALDEYNWLKPDLRPYGGAANTGKLAERTLPFVPSEIVAAWKRDGSKAPPPRIAALWDRGDPSPTYMYRRGDYLRPTTLVHAGVPAVLAEPGFRLDIQPPWPGAKQTGRRLALARWLTRPEHPLTSRVLVNRIWRHHFGRGLVRSLDNFGLTGAAPSHPELLDWLAQEFVRQGWRIKALHRLILTSRAYRQSALVSPEADRQDPENVLLARMPLRRLDAEAIWDSCAAVADSLDITAFGPAVPVEARKDGLIGPGRSGNRWRRSIYVQQVRKEIPALLEAFDLPAMNPNCVERSESIVPTQALHLLNDALLFELAERFAARILRESASLPAARVEYAFRLALARAPSAAERTDAVRTVEELCAIATTPRVGTGLNGDPPGGGSPELRAYASLCRMLLNSAEFLYVD